MSKAKVAVVFYSTYGTNLTMAQTAADAAREAGAEVRLLKIAETAPQEAIDSQDGWKATIAKTADIPTVSHDDMEWANAYIFVSPTRYGVVASQVRAFIDTLGGLWFQGKLANKVFSAMTSAQNAHGGQETTLISLYTTAMHWGAILVPPGYTDQSIFAAGGNPYGFSMSQGELTDEGKAAIAHQAKRVVTFADKIA
jgi:NAD(P)H dehydrogenase (quinone)